MVHSPPVLLKAGQGENALSRSTVVRMYGYVYTVLTELVTKVIDEKTMLVDNVN
jgi:hypothetical protein